MWHAWGIKLDQKKNLVERRLATRRPSGDFYEAICFAKEKQLPLLFSSKTTLRHQYAHAQDQPLALKFWNTGDWRKIEGQKRSAGLRRDSRSIRKIRAGGGHSFSGSMWSSSSHTSSDDQKLYRAEEETARAGKIRSAQ